MNKRSRFFTELKLRGLFFKMLLAFVVGVSSVLIIVYFSNREAERYASINTILDQVITDCNKQKTLSQFLSKNALLFDSEKADQSRIIARFDSALTHFNAAHNRLEQYNNQLKESRLELSEIDSLYGLITPIHSALMRNSYGIQEASNIENFKTSILSHEESFLPLMTVLTRSYELLIEGIDAELEAAIKRQYWQLALAVILAAGIVFMFTTQIVKEKVRRNKDHFMGLFSSKERYESLFNATQEIVYELDREGKYTYVNPAYTKLTGFSLIEARNTKWTDHIPKKNLPEIVTYYTSLIKGQKKSCYREFPIIISSGEERWIAQSSDFRYDHSGRLLKVYNIARDITEERSSSLKEEKYKEGLRLLNELNSKSDLTIKDRLTDGLKLCLDFLGLDVGIISKIWMDEYQVLAYYPEDCGLSANQKFKLGNTYCDITLSQKGKVLGIDEMSMSSHSSHPCFETFQLESYIGAAYRLDGKVAGTVNFTSAKPRKHPFTAYEIDFIALVAKWVGSLLEIQENQEKILEEQSLLKTFVSSAPAALAMFDKHMNYISVSEKWLNDQNLSGDIIGKSHYKVFPEIPQEWKAMHKRALAGEVIKPGVEKFERSDGSVQWIKGEIHPWYKSKDKVGGIIIFITDLTEIKRQEEELRKAKEEAERAGKIKEQFLSTMSHEIRTPLNAIIGTTNLLEIEHPELAQSTRLKMLKFGSSNLLTLINDILDFQKIESGHLEIVEKTINLHELCENIIKTWRAVPNSSDVALVMDYAKDLGDYYKCDEVRLIQVLNNLLSNALKFTYEGTVKLEVSSGTSGHVTFSVSDSGIGIPQDKLASIFESFKQIHNQESLRKGGTGLGLSISKRLVELMGGELEVKSQVDVGTTFVFNLPLSLQSQGHHKVKSTVPSSADLSIRLLLVEDNLANQEIAKGFLTRWGIHVDVAHNGKEAVEMIESKVYDLMLIDVRMPIMDGYEATRAIRDKEDSYFKSLPIIALTASTLAESKSKMHACGMDEIVSKPFDPADLYEKVVRLSKRPKVQVDHVTTDTNREFAFLNEVLGGDQEKVLEIANMTVLSIEEDVRGSLEARKSMDRDKAHEHLHKMKSNLANLDLKHVSAKVPNPKNEHFWDELPGYLEEVEGNINKVKELL